MKNDGAKTQNLYVPSTTDKNGLAVAGTAVRSVSAASVTGGYINATNKASVPVVVTTAALVTDDVVTVTLTDAAGTPVTVTASAAAAAGGETSKTVNVDATTLADGAITVKAYVTNAGGLAGATFTGTAATKDVLALGATIPAAPTGANNSGTKLVITFDEALYVGGVAVADGDVKSLFAYDGNAANYTSATYDSAAKTVTLVFTAAEDTKKITVSTTLTDDAGNAIAATAYTYAAAGTIWN